MALRTLASLIDGLAEHGDAEAIIGHHTRQQVVWTRQQLHAETLRFAACLVHAGVAPGEPVALLATPRPEWPAALLAITRAGAVAMPLGDHLVGSELGRILDHSGCRHIVTAARYVRTLAALEGAAERTIILLDEGESAARGDLPIHQWRRMPEGDRPLPELSPDQPAVLVYTSGTTGDPKGVPLTHANLCTNIDALLSGRLAGPGDRLLTPLPLHHVYPLTVGTLSPFAAGAAMVIPAGITGPEISRALVECRCTLLIGVPRLYEAMVEGIERKVAAYGGAAQAVYGRLLAFSTWLLRRFGWRIGRTLFAPLHRQVGPALGLLASGGAPLKPETAWRLGGLGWEVLVGYGLSETSPILTFNLRGRSRVGAAGKPVDGIELRIAPMPDVDPGTGEVQARGASVFSGYWHNPQATKEAFTDDGFFRTGDLGYLDDDGYLFLVGRSKEMIVVGGGKNIFPEDVEQVYVKSDLVEEVAVLEDNERLVALFVPRIEPGAQANADDLRQRLRGFVESASQELPSYERIGDFAVSLEPLPRTQVGKLRRHLLPEVFAEAKAGRRADTGKKELSEQDRALLDSTPAGEVWAWLQARFEGTPLYLDSSPQLDLGLDSFAWMSLAMELQERFGCQLDDETLGRITTLRGLLQEVQNAAESGQTMSLDQAELAAEHERWLRPRGPALLAFARVGYEINRAIMRGLYRVRAEGLEHLPKEGPLLITPNHGSFLDPAAIGAVLSWQQLRRVYWAGWTGIMFKGWIGRAFSRASQTIPVDPERGLSSTLLLARAILDRGRMLTWFPEGGRTPDGTLQKFLPGAGLLIQKTKVPAVPVWISGAYEAWPIGQSLPRLHPIRLRFGAPLTLADSEPPDAPDSAQRIANRLRDAVLALADDRAAGPCPPSSGTAASDGGGKDATGDIPGVARERDKAGETSPA